MTGLVTVIDAFETLRAGAAGMAVIWVRPVAVTFSSCLIMGMTTRTCVDCPPAPIARIEAAVVAWPVFKDMGVPLSDVWTELPAVATLIVPPLIMLPPVMEMPPPLPSALTCVILAATVECAAGGKWFGNENLFMEPRKCTCENVDDTIALDVVGTIDVVKLVIKCLLFAFGWG